MVDGAQKFSNNWGVAISCYAHAGDGNLHTIPVINPEWSEKFWHEKRPSILQDLSEMTASLGSTLEGEHDIGHKRQAYMSLVCNPATL